MANRLVKAETLVDAALGLLTKEVILPNLVWRDAESNYQGAVGPRGDTVKIRRPAELTPARELAWRDSNREIVTDDLVEGYHEVKLDTYLYKAVQLLREEQTLDIADFGAQVLTPMVNVVAEGAEQRIAETIREAPYKETITAGTGDRAVYNSLVDANKFLNQHRVPRIGRVAVVGSEVEARALKDPTLVDVDRSGSDSALRDAQIGRIAGHNMYGSDVIDPNALYVFHPTAFPAVFRAPNPARSVPFSSSAVSAGVAMTYWESLDSRNDSDRAFLGTFLGVNHIEDLADPTDPTGDTEFVRGVKIVFDDDTTPDTTPDVAP
ncbi:P22 phage major capsid protein family protein [Auritidibacter ignavus]|uniref:P22 phage major capsid protein family protein n=1 Tax=Auritidibacter ignavus TaxID=678932 RepID=UPI000F037E01|nr:P22 phage major capsid protein family protein [Auritidibacter ignavus]NIH70493.1 hypothetical protein [Auritidibacter ignavus]RMX23318.1 hypothetical protein DYI20_05480 [Auritidibacter ignavus]WGH91445.1 P22 phage major capsid protein family protein [Auritidibacter ignavus]